MVDASEQVLAMVVASVIAAIATAPWCCVHFPDHVVCSFFRELCLLKTCCTGWLACCSAMLFSVLICVGKLLHFLKAHALRIFFFNIWYQCQAVIIE